MLEITPIFNGMARIFPTYKHWCRKWDRNLKISAKKAVFLVWSGKKQISPLLAPRKKTVAKIH